MTAPEDSDSLFGRISGSVTTESGSNGRAASALAVPRARQDADEFGSRSGRAPQPRRHDAHATKNDSPPRAIGYCRVSTDSQASDGVSLDVQREKIAEWAARKMLDGPIMFEDAGISGNRIDRRPGLLAAIDELRTGDVLAVTKRDRLARGDPMLICWIEKEVARRGARIVSLAGEGTDGDDPDSPTDLLMRRIIDAFSEYERLVIRARTLIALAHKRARRGRTGSIPYGWQLVDPDSKKKNAFLVEEPDEQAVLARIREWHAAGDTLRDIAAKLTAEGVPSKHGNAAWSHQTVARIVARMEVAV